MAGAFSALYWILFSFVYAYDTYKPLIAKKLYGSEEEKEGKADDIVELSAEVLLKIS